MSRNAIDTGTLLVMSNSLTQDDLFSVVPLLHWNRAAVMVDRWYSGKDVVANEGTIECFQL